MAAAKDARSLALMACLSKRGPSFIEEWKAGAEYMLRSNWASVERLAAWVRSIGELTPPSADSLVRMALETPQRVLAPDIDTFASLIETLANAPEFQKDFDALNRALSAELAA